MALKISQLTFEMQIPNISKLENFCSPEFIIQEVPWRILVGKEQHDTKQWLAVYLHCIKKDLSADWSYAAVSSFKLKPFSEDRKAVQRHVQPFIFNRMDHGFGTGSFIEWSDLFNSKMSFVKDDTIKMDITVEVADPSDKNKSELTIENIHNSNYHSKFHLNITNIQHLMAVRSPVFEMRNQLWYLTVCKDHSSNLVVRLHSNSEISCRERMLVRLVPFQKSRRPVEQVKSENVQPGGIFSTTKLISWDNLLKPQNGFVNNNSISIDVEITTEGSKQRFMETAIIKSIMAEDTVWN